MRKKSAKKRPSDYPQMAFRVSAEDKARLESLIAILHAEVNQIVSIEDFKIKKNQLIVDALFHGLLSLQKGKFRRLLG